MSDVLLLDPRTSPDPVHEREPVRSAVDAVDAYELPRIDLERYAGLVVGGMVDQEFLYRERDVIRSYLGLGRVVVFCGHLLRAWLPGCGLFVPTSVTSFRDYTVRLVTPHPVFAGVDPHDLTFRRGVAGFFARGHHPPPPGAQVLAALAAGQPATYVDRTTTEGTILAHAGADLLGYGEAGSSAARLAPQLLDWVREEGRA